MISDRMNQVFALFIEIETVALLMRRSNISASSRSISIFPPWKRGLVVNKPGSGILLDIGTGDRKRGSILSASTKACASFAKTFSLILLIGYILVRQVIM